MIVPTSPDLEGKIKGGFLVLEKTKKRSHGFVVWKVMCLHCQRNFEVLTHSLNKNKYGCNDCSTQECVLKHGHGYNTPTYKSFHCAKQRCENPKDDHYHNYGERGIEFKFKNFEEFLSHVGGRPTGKTLDRINNEGHYELGNVRWASTKTQNRNSRHTILNIEKVKRIKSMLHTGVKATEIASYYGVTSSCIYSIKYGKSWVDIEMEET